MTGSEYVSLVYNKIGMKEPRAPVFSIVIFCMHRSRNWVGPVQEVAEALQGWDFLSEFPTKDIPVSKLEETLLRALG